MKKMLLGALTVLLVSTVAFGQGMMVPSGEFRSLPPLAIKSQQVEIAIKDQVATTTVKQVFINSTPRQLEANYVFPLPPDATIRDFSMIVNGKLQKGDVVEAAKAKQIYQQIVAQSRDPGLLEHLGNDLFRLNVFPIPANGTQSTEITYSQVIKGSSGLFRYVYPLHTAGKASQVQDFFSIGAKLTSKTAIKTVYSPTHEIGVSRKGDHEATVGLEQNKALLDKDFSLYWTISEKDFGLNALAYRPKADEPGYLMLMISPKSAVNEKEVIAKDVVFVFDTSGSMQGPKIEQAKKALKFCVESLNEKDRFGIVTFNTDVSTYKDGLIDATKANKEGCRDFINRLNAEGGTNIHEALGKSLAIVRDRGGADKGRPAVVVFLADGRPTIGKTGTDEILGVVGAKGTKTISVTERPEDAGKSTAERGDPPAEAVRIFTFGVGDDVNAKLLDQVAGKSGGQPEYVRPNEDIEVKVSDFFAKASHPVMTGLKLAFGGSVRIDGMFPQNLPDLYFGQQIIAFARYDGSGDIAVTLSGKVSDGSVEKPTYEVSLPKQATDNDFIEPLWAHRKVGYLLDQIRLNGENKELKDEVVRLSVKYRIQTPYTSYLVLEDRHRKQYLPDVAGADGSKWQNDPRGVVGGRGGGMGQPQQAAPPARPSVAPGGTPSATDPKVAADLPALPSPLVRLTEPADRGNKDDANGKEMDKLRDLVAEAGRKDREARQKNPAAEGSGWGDYAASGPRPTTQPDSVRFAYDEKSLREESGAAAIGLSKAIEQMKRSDSVAGKSAGGGAEKKAAGRTFYLLNGFWIDERFATPVKLTFVKWGSEAYFAIVSAHVELKDVFALGTRVIVTTADGKALVVSETDGDEKMTEKEIKALFKAEKK